MAPKNKFTREEMTRTALTIIREKGADALTAKAIAERLGTSTRPIFTCFGTMEEVRREVRLCAEDLFREYTEAGLKEQVPFLGYGKQYLRFAGEEPELFRLLFLSGNRDRDSGMMPAMKRSFPAVCPSLMRIYHLDETDAERFFRDLWLVVFSLATLKVTGGCPYSGEEIGGILTGFSVAVCKAIKEVPGFAGGQFDRDEVFRGLIAEKT